MTVTYTNRKNTTYTLYRSVTKTGKPRYFFAKQSKKGVPCESIPDGYEISESPNGIVSLVKERPKLIQQDEVELVERALATHPQSSNYRLFVRHDRIDVYERVGPSAEELSGMLRSAGFGVPLNNPRLQAHFEARSQFSPVLRFVLLDEKKRTYGVERMCYLGSIDDWIGVGKVGSLGPLAEVMIPRLGNDSFFELY